MPASTPSAGYQGIFKVSTVTLTQVQSVEISNGAETYDITVISGSATPVWKDFISGLRSYTLKVVGFWDQVNDAAQVTLWSDFNSGVPVAWSYSPNGGTNTFSGNAVFTSLPFKFAVNAVETAEWDFQGKQAVTFA